MYCNMEHANYSSKPGMSKSAHALQGALCSGSGPTRSAEEVEAATRSEVVAVGQQPWAK